MSVYSQRFMNVRAGTSSGGPYSSAAVPAGFVWVVRSLTVVAVTTGDGNCLMSINDGATDLAVIGGWVVTGVTQVVGVDAPEVRIVLNAGENLLFTVQSGIFDLSVSGYQLSNS